MEESKALKERWLREKEEDLRRKVQIIKEIKALQALGVIKRKQIQSSESTNLGFLCEMSIVELKERLYILRIEVQEELERRRASIKIRRECRKEIINSYQELIESHQQLIKEQKKNMEFESNKKKEKVEEQRNIKRSSSCLDNLRRKLYETRRERIKNSSFI